MWSTARQLEKGRKRQRKKHAETASQIAKRMKQEEDEINWKPTRAASAPSRLNLEKSKVPPLVNIILEWIADRAEDVETLAGLPDSVRMKLSGALTKRRRINSETVHLLTDGAATEVEIGNCADLDEEQLGDALEKCDLKRMEALRLHFCGRGLTRHTVERLLRRGESEVDGMGKHTAKGSNRSTGKTKSKSASEPQLESLPLLKEALLRGAYRMSDEGLHLLLSAAQNLESLSLMSCTRLSPSGIADIASKVRSLRTLDLYQCQQLDCANIVATVSELPRLERLRVKDLPQMTDEAVSDMVSNIGDRLLELDVGFNPQLTRITVAAIGACCPNIEVLKMERLPKLNEAQPAAKAVAQGKLKGKAKVTESAAATEESAGECSLLDPLIDGCRRLTKLFLEELDVPDAHLARLLANGSPFTHLSMRRMPGAGNQSCIAISRHLDESLAELDVSFSRNMNSSGLGLIADSCKRLRVLSIWGCTQITNKFYDGHSNDDLKIVGSHDARR